MDDALIIGVDRSSGPDESCYAIFERGDNEMKLLETFDNAEDAYMFIWSWMAGPE